MKRGGLIVTALAGGLLGAVLLAAAGRSVVEQRVFSEVDTLLARGRSARRATLTETHLAGLPEPVRRWLRYSRVVGRERPVTVRLRQRGLFRLGPQRGWMPFEAEQYYTTDPPGFVWVARFQMAPAVSIFGRDRYADGVGSIRMWLLYLILVASKSGGGLNQGALLRYLNETMWFPAAATSPYITWEAVGAHAARATMRYGGVSGSATFVFDEQGRLAEMTAERFDDAVGGLQPWSTPIAAYGQFDGVRVPVAGEGRWRYPSSDFTYIRLRVTDLEYDRPDRF
ncbi:MAG: hypothetical protein QN120_09510 [Armatimonadota bacterium]|nr:hypothetical protein [Armatimonadota bacterium]